MIVRGHRSRPGLLQLSSVNRGYNPGSRIKLTFLEISTGVELCWPPAWNTSAQTLHEFIAMCSSLGRRHTLRLLGGADRQGPLLYFQDRVPLSRPTLTLVRGVGEANPAN